jgi:hypothetical protein
MVPGMPQVMEVDCWQSGGIERGKPYATTAGASMLDLCRHTRSGRRCDVPAALKRIPVKLSAHVEDLKDPLEIFRCIAELRPDMAETAQSILTKLETSAAHRARPTPGSSRLMVATRDTGRTLTIVSNNSSVAAVIGFANKQNKAELLTSAGADAVTTRLSEITRALQIARRY